MRRTQLVAVAVTLPVMLVACARQPPIRQSSTADTSVLTVLDAKVPKWLEQYGVPSISIAYVRNGAIAWTRAYGEQAEGIPATGWTLYNVASLTKPVFAELVVRLAAAGRLSLDEPMAPYWVDPDVARDPRHRALTPRMALSHRIGFTNWRRETKDTLRFTFEPGSSFRYPGEGYEYASRFVQRKLGASLEALAQQYVFGPFGMRNTSWAQQPWFHGRTAMPMGPEGKYGRPDFSPNGNAADNIWTTAGDYALFLIGVMNRRGMSAALAKQRDSIHSLGVADGAGCEPQKVRRCPSPYGYSLGWSVMEYPDGPVLWHTGADWGEKAMAFYFPTRREGMVLLTNGTKGFEPMIEIIPLVAPGTDFADFIAAARR
jgi:CubicO group peptidase (beta-lactamase class C family)